MNRRDFIGALALAPLLVKEAIAVQNKRFPGPGWLQGESWIEFEVPMTKMNWEMQVTDIGDHTMKIYNKGVLPEFYNDQFRRSRRKNGLIKLGKASR